MHSIAITFIHGLFIVRTSFLAEVSLLSLVKRMKVGVPFTPHSPGYEHPYEQTEMSRSTSRLEKNLLFGEQARETR
jgi:hypothetical protein